MKTFPFRCVAFDLDGTVADTAPDLAASLNHTLAAMDRRQLELADVRTLVGHGTRALLRGGLAATGAVSDDLIEAGYPILMAHYAANICTLTRPYPGIERALDTLAGAGAALAICTNKPEHLARQLIDALGWNARFAAIVGGDTLPVAKPDAAPLHFAIQSAGGGPAAFVGDSIVDMQTARAAAVPGIAVTFGYADRPPGQLGAAATIAHFDELVPQLGKYCCSAELAQPGRRLPAAGFRVKIAGTIGDRANCNKQWTVCRKRAKTGAAV